MAPAMEIDDRINTKSEPARDHAGTLDLKFRLMGALPLIFFLAQLIHYWREGGIANMLWMCNIGNLALAIGIFAGHRELIRLSAIWMIPGLALWFVYVFLPSGLLFTSSLAHIGGFVVAIIALRKVRVDRRAWVYAFVWYLIMQVISRIVTSPDANVNVAHRIQPGWDSTFGSYWAFWPLMTLVVAVGLWLLGRLLNLLWPNAPQNSAVTRGGARF
jgi:hypothetical protein